MRRVPSASVLTPGLRWRTRAFALVLYTAFLAASAPASLFALGVSIATQGMAHIEGAHGSFWHGRGTVVVAVERSGEVHRYEEISWKWVGLHPALELRIEDRRLRSAARIVFLPDSVRTEGLEARLPASTLTDYIPALSHLALSGELYLAGDLVFDKAERRGTAMLQWHNAASALTDVRPLGEYRARIAGNRAQGEFRVETVTGILYVEGSGSWTTTAGISFEGTARAEAERRPELANVLDQIGADLGGGIHRLSFAAARLTHK
jgi:general secretion pathway protein N